MTLRNKLEYPDNQLVEFSFKGDVYAVDSRTLFIKDFSYDGTGPDAYFYAGSSGSPSGKGFLIPNEKGSEDILRVRKD